MSVYVYEFWRCLRCRAKFDNEAECLVHIDLCQTPELTRLKTLLGECKSVIDFYSNSNGQGEDSNFCIYVSKEGEELIHEVSHEGFTCDIGAKARALREKIEKELEGK